jgi:glycosyltransferase involved in cell wall biosynthesis
MRILLVHNRYRSAAPSGENRVVDQEGEALAALGHEVLRFGRNSDEIEQWSLAQKASLPVRIIWSRETYRELTALLQAQRPEVVHVHNTFPLLSAAVLHACRNARIPVVATIHNYKLMCASGTFFRDGHTCYDCARGSAAPAVLHGCYRESRAATTPVVLATGLHRKSWRSLPSAYIFISAAQRDLLRGFGFPADRVFVRHNLIPHRDRPQITRTASVIYAGRLDEAKGVRLLMAGWDAYREKASEPGLKLVIAGGGPLEDEMAAWSSTRPSVEMHGTVSSDRCAELISHARAVLLPSTWQETFGLVAVEAMAAGVPPIATGHGAFPELITPGVDGVLFSPDDPAELALAIADVEADPARYEGYGEQARRTYEERFNPERSVTDLLGIYRFAIAHPVWPSLSPLREERQEGGGVNFG